MGRSLGVILSWIGHNQLGVDSSDFLQSSIHLDSVLSNALIRKYRRSFIILIPAEASDRRIKKSKLIKTESLSADLVDCPVILREIRYS